MYFSPVPNKGVYLNSIEQNQITDDYECSSPHTQYSPHSQYSASKKMDKKRKTHSINEMIRKVEQEIMHSEMNINQVNQDQKSKSSHNSCKNSFSSVLQQQQQQHLQQQFTQPMYMQSHSPRQQPLQRNQQRFQLSPQTHSNQQTPSIKNNQFNYNKEFIYQNSNIFDTNSQSRISTISGTKQTNQPMNTENTSTSNSNIFSQSYITIRDFRTILEDQLSSREQSIISQISSCLKEQIIPEIKRQVIRELDKKKQEIDTQIQNFHQQVSENQSIQFLNDKISNLKMSFDRSKFVKSQAEIKSQTIDQKFYHFEERMNKLEEQSLEYITILEHYKFENQEIISDFKNAKRQWNRIDAMIENLSRSLIGLNYSVQKNYEDITKKINELETTEEVPFNLKKDKYSSQLIDEIKNQLNFQVKLSDSSYNQSNRISEVQEKQEPYSNVYQVNTHQKNKYSFSCSKNIENLTSKENGKKTTENFEEYDISPTLVKSEQKKISSYPEQYKISPSNCLKAIKLVDIFNQQKNIDQNEEDLYDYDYNSRIREVNISNRNKLQNTQFNDNDQTLKNKMDSQQINENFEGLNTYEDASSNMQQSGDIHYIKKGLPQIFPYVESTNYAAQDNQSMQVEDEQDSQKMQMVVCSDLKDIDKNEIISVDNSIKLSEVDLNKRDINLLVNKDKFQTSLIYENSMQIQNIGQICSQKQKDQNQSNSNGQLKSQRRTERRETDENSFQEANNTESILQSFPIQTFNHSMKKSDQKQCHNLSEIINNNRRIPTETYNLDSLIQNKIDIHPNFSINDSQY